MTPEYLLQQLQWRYATKKFDATRKISAAEWRALEEALVLAPSSFGLQPWKFVVVENPELRARLLPLSWNQGQVVDASHLLVCAVRVGLAEEDVDRLIRRTMEVRGVSREKLEGYRKLILGFCEKLGESGGLEAWAARQVYIALGGLLTGAALLGLDACPLEGIDPEGYTEVLGLSGYRAICAVALGYRAIDDGAAQLAKVRYPIEEVVEYR
jgi:nitroreductase